MRKALVVAIALVAIAIPTAATAQTTAVKPVVISITAVNGRPVGGIKQPDREEGPDSSGSSSARTSAPRSTCTATTSRRRRARACRR